MAREGLLWRHGVRALMVVLYVIAVSSCHEYIPPSSESVGTDVVAEPPVCPGSRCRPAQDVPQDVPMEPTGNSGDGATRPPSAGGRRTESPESTIRISGLPPDPTSIAPSLSRVDATPFIAATAFLYRGRDPIQVGVADGAISPERAAVVRGRVVDRSGQPLPGVELTVVGHPEYGTTLTRADGIFDMVVDGGGRLTFSYRMQGSPVVQRSVDPSRRDFAWLPDVMMIPYAPEATIVDLEADGYRVVRGALEDGRASTLLFPPGLRAWLRMDDGSRRPLSRLTVRTTEYTRGEGGPSALPAELPASSGYTYAVELSADEADEAGARLEFDRPVPVYVEDFRGFPAGTIVPSGYYDRLLGRWIASDDGVVVALLGKDGSGLAVVDVDGSGTAADDASLAALGITADERRLIATLYREGQRLWRVPVGHFTPWDFNLPVGPGRGAVPPATDGIRVLGDDRIDDPLVQCNASSIACQNQVLRESERLVGIPFRLVYGSDRVPGRLADFSLSIPLLGAIAPPELESVALTIEIAGQRHAWTYVHPVSLPLRHEFVWDGRDAYGRPVLGSRRARITIEYRYRGHYYQARTGFERSFAGLAGAELSLAGGGGGGSGSGTSAACSPTTRYDIDGTPYTYLCAPPPVVRVRRRIDHVLGHLDAMKSRLGGWTPEVLHAYDPVGRVLYLGDGRRQRAWQMPVLITTVAGVHRGSGGAVGRSLPGRPQAVVFAPDGGLYFSEHESMTVWRLDPHGGIEDVVSGVMASALAVDDDGRLYLSDLVDDTVKRVGDDGRTEIVVGGGRPDASGIGDGGDARLAVLSEPHGLAFSEHGDLYVVDSGHRRLRRVSPDGTISTVAGGGPSTQDGIDATDAFLYYPYGVVAASSGDVYLSDRNNGRVHRLDRLGRLHVFAGVGEGFAGDGGPALQARLCHPEGLALDRSGRLVIADACNDRIRRIEPDRTITTIAGSDRPTGDDGDRVPALRASLDDPADVAIDGERIAVADRFDWTIRMITPALPDLSGDEIALASRDGDEIFVFDRSGRHLRTVDALTEATIWRFGYDRRGWLVSVTDRGGNVTTISRDERGRAFALVSPYGRITRLTLDERERLVAATDPAGRTIRYDYTEDGLLILRGDPAGNVSEMAYDAKGRLVLDEGASGRRWSLVHETLEDGYTVAKTSALGLTTRYDIRLRNDGGMEQTIRFADGTERTERHGGDGVLVVEGSDGSLRRVSRAPDPVGGMGASYPVGMDRTLPSGLTRRLRIRRHRVGMALQGGVVEEIDLDGRRTTIRYETSTRRLTITTPAGRVAEARHDRSGRIDEIVLPGAGTWSRRFDERGRLVAIEGVADGSSRLIQIGYDGLGRPDEFVDFDGTRTRLVYDGSDRVVRRERPDGRTIDFRYDEAGRVVAIEPPGRPFHVFERRADGLVVRHGARSGRNEGTRYVRDLDGRTIRIVRPGGQAIDLGRDEAGRLQTISTATSTSRIGYDPLSGRVNRLSSSDGETIRIDYDGPLRIREVWSGPVSATLERSYDSSFLLSRMIIDGMPVDFVRDADGLVVRAGPERLTRGAADGRIVAVSAGVVETRISRNGFGEETGRRVLVDGRVVYRYDLVRDAGGRIVARDERFLATATSARYAYDALGRLVDVVVDGSRTYRIAYDANGNRVGGEEPRGTITASYDDGDVILDYRGVVYGHSPAGDLAWRDDHGRLTRYHYDAVGALRRVELPDGHRIDYLIDAAGRRIAERIDGRPFKGWLYRDGLAPVAELDADGNVRSRFVYASRSNLPDLMLRDGRTYRLIGDERGSLRLVVDTETGRVVQQMAYDAFGRVLVDTNPGFQPFGFAGGLYDPRTGLTRFGARDYDPVTGRWTAPDPILFAGGDTNFYRYVRGDPVNRVDPEGTCGVGCPIILGALVGGLSSAITTYFETKSIVSSIESGLGGALGGASAVVIFLAAPETMLGVSSSILFDLSISSALHLTSITPLLTADKVNDACR